MVSGFIVYVEGHIINRKFVVVGEVRHSQHMNVSLIPVWIITEKHGTIVVYMWAFYGIFQKIPLVSKKYFLMTSSTD